MFLMSTSVVNAVQSDFRNIGVVASWPTGVGSKASIRCTSAHTLTYSPPPPITIGTVLLRRWRTFLAGRMKNAKRSSVSVEMSPRAMEHVQISW